MSRAISPVTHKPYGLKRVCKIWGVSRSTLYRKATSPKQRGPKPGVEEPVLLDKIRKDLEESPFRGEGHRKIHARLKKQGIKVGRNRVLKVMRNNALLSPHRTIYRPPNPHEGRIATDAPNVMWATDGTKVQTVEEGWVWIFSVAEHWNAECLGWHVCKVGDRFAALEPVSQAVKTIYGSLSKGIATGLKLRMDNGSQYTSEYFLQQIKYLGLESSFGLVRQPETNGIEERFQRTLKEQAIDGRTFRNADDVREAVKQFVRLYNEKWLLAKLGYESPLEARRNHEKLRGVA
jgi:putative transposase